MSGRIPLRPVEENWTCKQSGDCCTHPAFVYMTVEERRIVELSASFHNPNAKLVFQPDPDPASKFVRLVAGPCPLHVLTVDGKISCSIYSSRPYNCRRFGCMRPDPTTEPWEENENGGCMNLLERVRDSRVARRLAELTQRRAQKWALKTGWTR